LTAIIIGNKKTESKFKNIVTKYSGNIKKSIDSKDTEYIYGNGLDLS